VAYANAVMGNFKPINYPITKKKCIFTPCKENTYENSSFLVMKTTNVYDFEK